MADLVMPRRGLLAAALASAGAGTSAATAPSTLPLSHPAWTSDSIQAAAERRGVAFGSAVNITSLRLDPAYGPLIASESGIVVAENEMKMEYVEPAPERPSFTGADETYAFARHNGMLLRGTVLVWYRGMPDWAQARITPGNAEAFMRRWIGLIGGRYAGQVDSWDVVNEIIDPRGRDAMRASPWLDALGPGYADLAFHLAREADPRAAGIWNEEDLELDADWMDARRAAVLRTLEGMLKRGVPIRRFGLQSHLNSTIPFSGAKLRAFLSELAGMGLGIEITELDVDDRAYPADAAARDQGVADLTRRYLDVVLDEPAVLNVLTWDIIDRNTWYNTSARRRRDGAPQRSLPVAADYTRKPMYQAIRAAFAAAPDHAAARRAKRAAA